MGKRDSVLLACDSILARANNLKAGIRFQLSGQKNLLKQNQKLKVRGSIADTCFVIGNGPSLKAVDLSLVEPFPCFTVNLFHQGSNRFRSAYHLFIDPGFQEDDLFPYVRQAYAVHEHTIFILNNTLRNKLRKEGLADGRTYFIDVSHISHGDMVCCNMQGCMSGSLNVIPIAIECAIYMGYKKICLLGCDFNSYAVARNEHFYDTPGYEDKTPRRCIVGDLVRCALVHNQHYALDRYSRAHGSAIINLTEGSLIDAYERDTLEHILPR